MEDKNNENQILIDEALKLMRNPYDESFLKGNSIFDKLIEQGSVSAILQRASIYEIIEKDFQKAKELYEKIAMYNSKASASLGNIYHHQLSDYENAKYWYEIAAKLGSSWAERRLQQLDEDYS